MVFVLNVKRFLMFRMKHSPLFVYYSMYIGFYQFPTAPFLQSKLSTGLSAECCLYRYYQSMVQETLT
ncbi:uncharacterized protein MELLADRAFT_71715 [Melampsora larici-populina 98AG31]|uniref:Uncharacterized protein n=1 Tax=Melampsora larici-populina (strain 98AG31 / pathotype 3-4-7) TaxID=747676 RepID=F4RJQ0_MELLP|nr:uncharacterized protein MELLADRAFT_71715 [Melampsora larici-populina 98AG31]EGG07349.1 hypothetical protein MELLADRAFT_71715 [Melampsora larici-populina 98AG31]